MAWSLEAIPYGEMSTEQKTVLTENKLQGICRMAMPKSRPNGKTNMYCWSDEIENRRKTILAARRKLQRCRWRKVKHHLEEERLHRDYKEKVMELRRAIREAKEREHGKS